MKKLLFLFLLMILPNCVLAATCAASEKANLLTLSGIVEVNYVEESFFLTGEDIGYPEDLPLEDYDDYVVEYNFLKINLFNLTEEFYAVITNNVTDEEIIVEYDDLTDGMYSFKHPDLSVVYTYKVTIYASSETGCDDVQFATKYLVIPKYNMYSSFSMCNDFKDEAVCQRYTTVSTYTEAYVLSKLYDYQAESSENSSVDSDDENIKDFFETYGKYIIPGGVIVAGVIATLVIVNKKRSDLK